MKKNYKKKNQCKNKINKNINENNLINNENNLINNENNLIINDIFNILEPFLYKDIISEKSENILYELNKPTFEQVVFTYENEDISIMNGYHTIIKIDNEYRLYFRSSNNLEFKYYTTEESAAYENFCLITSDDGLTFKKNKKELFQNLFCHNFFPYYSTQQNKFIGISGTGMFQKGIYLFESNDGFNWDKKEKIIKEDMICNNWTHPNHFDSLNCLVYNDIDNFYYIYMRHNNNIPLRRFVQFSKTRDFVNFTKCKLINIINDDKTQIYISGIFKYFNSNYFLSIPTLHINDKAVKNLMISDNNVDWVIIDNNLISDDKPRYIVQGMVPSLDNKKIYFYTFDEPDIKNSYISCYSYPIHRINKIYCKEEGFIKTKIINLSNSSMTINLETNENGYIIIEIYDQANNIILKSNKLIGNEFNLIVNWEGQTILEKNNYYVKFIINNAYLYSFTYNIK